MESPQQDRFVEQLVACHSRLYRFIATLVANRTDAEELLQQTGLAAWRSRETFDPARDFFPWICGIARNHVRRYYRSRKAAPVFLAGDVVEQLVERQLADEPLLERRQQVLTDCLEKLPERQRTFVRQFYESLQTVKSFAQQQKVTADAAYKLLQRVRTTLFDCVNRTMLAEEEPC
jgi:RNA polymerase sigma-70 factor, ECF subfamily